MAWWRGSSDLCRCGYFNQTPLLVRVDKIGAGVSVDFRSNEGQESDVPGKSEPSVFVPRGIQTAELWKSHLPLQIINILWTRHSSCTRTVHLLTIVRVVTAVDALNILVCVCVSVCTGFAFCLPTRFVGQLCWF